MHIIYIYARVCIHLDSLLYSIDGFFLTLRQYYKILITAALEEILKLDTVNLPNLLFLKVYFYYSESLAFPYEF